LYRDPHPPARAGEVFSDVDLSVVDHNGLGHDRRSCCHDAGVIEGFQFNENRLRHAVWRPESVLRPVFPGRHGPEGLVEHGGGVDGFRRYRS
jgi:hypothetical protein